MELAQMTPVEIDTALSKLWNEEQKWRMYAATERSYRSSWLRNERRLAEIDARIAEYAAKVADYRTQAEPFEAEYSRRGGWNRYFLVTNANGHVHRGTNCGTCFPTTTYSWLVELASCDEAAMVAEYGEMACTICFPAAPSLKGFGDGSSAYARRTAEEKAQRAAEKAEREAKKAAKTLTPELRFRDMGDWKVETLAAAKQALRDALYTQNVAGTSADYNGYESGRLEKAEEVANRARHALVAKGVSEIEIEKLVANATKKAKKEIAMR